MNFFTFVNLTDLGFTFVVVPLTKGHPSYQARFQMHWDYQILQERPLFQKKKIQIVKPYWIILILVWDDFLPSWDKVKLVCWFNQGRTASTFGFPTLIQVLNINQLTSNWQTTHITEILLKLALNTNQSIKGTSGLTLKYMSCWVIRDEISWNLRRTNCLLLIIEGNCFIFIIWLIPG